MRCPEAVERMMTADPAELRREADTPLVRHIRQCASCAAIAATLTRELHALDLGLAGLAEGATAARGGLADSMRPARPPTRRPTWRRAVWLPLAAAAGIAAVLVLGQAEEERAAPSPGAPVAGAEVAAPRGSAGRAGAGRVGVRPPDGVKAAVLETRDPKITIVWLYEREGT